MYTNGYKYADVLSVLQSRVGWREDNSLTLSVDNKKSDSGRYFNDGSFHSLVTVKNIIDVMEENEANSLDMQKYLQNLTVAAVGKVLSVFNAPQYLSQTMLFERYGRGDQTINHSGVFAGWKFRVANDDAVAVQIPTVRLYFNEAATFNLYLFQDGIPAPVKTKEATTAAYQFVDVELTDWYLKKGIYYVGYFQDDLGTTKAIHENTTTYNHGFVWQAYPVALAKKDTERIDAENELGGGYTHGLNFTVNAFKDFTQRIIRNASLFDSALGYAVACSVIQTILTSTRSNATERILKDATARIEAMYDLNGTVPAQGIPKKQGLKGKLDEELEIVKQSFFPTPKAVSVCLH